jgi:sterol desaturase/sphingolipid hydroxylase (fatty acid hydroxylase superfamily)
MLVLNVLSPSSQHRMGDLWTKLLNDHSPQVIEFCGTLLVQLVFFWLPSAFYLALDHLAPKFSQRHKLQPQTKQPTLVETIDCLKVVLKNQIISAFIHIFLLSAGAITGGKPTYRFDVKLPSPDQIVRDVFACVVLREILFYYSHRVLHLPSIYPKIHKVHHRFTAPVALAAQYAHPIEHLLANTLPISFPPTILQCHVVTFWLFLAYQLLETSTVHSGYDFLSGIAKKHDAHHEKFFINFGSIGLLDWVHGTDGRARQKKVE